MAIQNRETLKANEAAFINRTAPYDGNALIQKAEDLEVRDNKSDSVIFKEVVTKSINNPAAAFDVDFGLASGTYGDQFVINTSSSIATDLSITISNLEGNEVGKLHIIKKTGQKFTFANARLLPDQEAGDHEGVVLLSYLIYNNNGFYLALPTYNRDKTIRIDSGTAQTKTARIEKNWDMDTLANLEVLYSDFPADFVSASQLTRPPSVLIKQGSSSAYDLGCFSVSSQQVQGATTLINDGAGSFQMERLNGGFFDQAGFSVAVAHITIEYTI